MKKYLLITSIGLNIAIGIVMLYIVHSKGGFDYIKFKLGIEKVSAYTPHYYERKSLFEVLPIDSTNIVFLGNSITEGCEWEELLKNSKIVNRGIGGDDTEGVLKRLSNIVSSKPKKIFLMIGINDFSAGRKKTEILANYEKIINQITKNAPKTVLYIQSLLPVNEEKNKSANNLVISELNLGLKQLANKYHITYIDLYSIFINKEVFNSIMSTDGVHLMGCGYLEWKKEIEKYIH